MGTVDRGRRSRRRVGWVLLLGLAAAGVTVPAVDAAPNRATLVAPMDSCGLGRLAADALASAAGGGRAQLTLVLPQEPLVCFR